MAQAILALGLAVVAASAPAQMVETHITASNGVIVDRNADEFAGRFEYSAPSIKFQMTSGGGSGVALVAKTRRAGSLGALNVQGFLSYSGSWQYFDSAVFKGGEVVDYKRTGGEVGSCRYGCSLSENFHMEFTPAQIKKYNEAGVIQVQIRASKSGSTALLSIPISYIDAVNEVAK